jgi:phosphosulfolactate phosphohydrolase-like enzyme
MGILAMFMLHPPSRKQGQPGVDDFFAANAVAGFLNMKVSNTSP